MGVLKKHGLFQDLQFVLDLGSLPFKKKKKLREDITSNGGYVSYILTKKSDFVLVSCENGSKVDTYKTRKAEQLKVPVVTKSYIEDCLDNNEILDIDEYKVAGETKRDIFSKGKIQVPEWQSEGKENSELKHLSTKEVKKLIPKQYSSDSETCPKFGGNFQVGKFAVLMEPRKAKTKYRICVLELHLPFCDEKKGNQEKSARFRIMEQKGVIAPNLTLTDKVSIEYFFDSCDEALMVMQYFVDKHINEDNMKLVSSLPRSPDKPIGSTKLIQIFDSMGSCSGNPNPQVLLAIAAMFQNTFETYAGPDAYDLPADKINKGVVVLMKIRDALAMQQPTDSLTKEYYATITCDESETPINDKKTLSKKFDFVQILQDLKLFTEVTGLSDFDDDSSSNSDSDTDNSDSFECSSSTSSSESTSTSDTDSFDSDDSNVIGARDIAQMQQGLRCSITWLPPEDSEYISVAKLMEDGGTKSPDGLKIINIFRLYRDIEFTDFTHSIPNKKLLLHASKPENFVGILCRGMLLPLVVVGEHGGDRTDCGLLGSGIYFSDDIRTTVQYSCPNVLNGTRFLLVNEVCLGNCHDFRQHQPDLTCPPEGYDSVRGVGQHEDSTSKFEANEYVIYQKNQQRLRYLVEFALEKDEIKSHKIAHIRQLSSKPYAKPPKSSKVSLDAIEKMSDPIDKVEPGLIVMETGKDKQVPLQQVHIRGNIIDMVAQVVVFQSYVNESNKALEAKYVFPLSGSAAVCGFEAFINDKHVVGKVKEKEVAHREYKEAISKGHGAYLMDEEKPEVFTVSVGNLPSSARVVIKITYVTELPVMINDKDLTDYIQFHLPSSLAPSVKDSVLVSGPITQTQMDRVTADSGKLCNFSLIVTVEMPFDIKRLECPTNKVKYKVGKGQLFFTLKSVVQMTRSKATVCLVNKERLSKDGFRLLIGLAEIHVPRMWSERHPDLDSQASMLAFYPEFDATPILAYKAIIMIDISNSITVSGLERNMKKLALMILKNLPTRCHINIIKFASHFEELFVKEQPLSDNSVKSKAEDFIQSCVARSGLSDAWRPLAQLDAVKKFSDDQTLTNIFLLSDGHLDEKNKTLQMARSLAGDSTRGKVGRIFTFSFGSSANQYLMKSIATASDGFHEHFSPKLKSKWKKKVESQLNKASQPVLTDIHIEWGKYADKDDSAHSEAPFLPIQAPEHISILYNSSRLVVYGMVPHCTSAQLFAKVCGKEISTVVSTSALSVTTGKTIHQLATRAMINDYEEGMHEVDPLKRDELKKFRRPHIVQLSIQHSIVSQYTSFVAVEEREKGENLVTGKGPSIQDLVLKAETDQLINLPWVGEEAEEDIVTLQKVYGKIKAAEVTYYSSLAQAQRMFNEVDEMIQGLSESELGKGSFVAASTKMKLGMEYSLADIDTNLLIALITEAQRENDKEIAKAISTILDFPSRYGLCGDEDSNRKVLQATKSGLQGIESLNMSLAESFHVFKEKLATHQGNDIFKAIDHIVMFIKVSQVVIHMQGVRKTYRRDRGLKVKRAPETKSGAVMDESRHQDFEAVKELVPDVTPNKEYSSQAMCYNSFEGSVDVYDDLCLSTTEASSTESPERVLDERRELSFDISSETNLQNAMAIGRKKKNYGHSEVRKAHRLYANSASAFASRVLPRAEELDECAMFVGAEQQLPVEQMAISDASMESQQATDEWSSLSFSSSRPLCSLGGGDGRGEPESMAEEVESEQSAISEPLDDFDEWSSLSFSSSRPLRSLGGGDVRGEPESMAEEVESEQSANAEPLDDFDEWSSLSFSSSRPLRSLGGGDVRGEPESMAEEVESEQSANVEPMHDYCFKEISITQHDPEPKAVSEPKALPNLKPSVRYKTTLGSSLSERKYVQQPTLTSMQSNEPAPPPPPQPLSCPTYQVPMSLKPVPKAPPHPKSTEQVSKMALLLNQQAFLMSGMRSMSMRGMPPKIHEDRTKAGFVRERTAKWSGTHTLTTSEAPTLAPELDITRKGIRRSVMRRVKRQTDPNLKVDSDEHPYALSSDVHELSSYHQMIEKERELSQVAATRLRSSLYPGAIPVQTMKQHLQKSVPEKVPAATGSEFLNEETFMEAIHSFSEEESSYPWAQTSPLKIARMKNEVLLQILREAGGLSLGQTVFDALYEMVRVAVIATLLKEYNCKNTDVHKIRQKIVSTQMAWLKKMDSIYPSLYTRLELGKSWEDAAKNIVKKICTFPDPTYCIKNLFFQY